MPPQVGFAVQLLNQGTGHNVPCRDFHQNPSLASSLGLQPSHGFKLTACCYLLSRDGQFNSEQHQISWKQYEAVLVLVLVCHAATQLAIQLHQERIQVVRSNRVARKRPAESNGTPAMELGFEDIRKRKHTNKKRINKTHIHKHATCRNSSYMKKELILHCILLLYCCVCIFHCVCYKSGLLKCG